MRVFSRSLFGIRHPYAVENLHCLVSSDSIGHFLVKGDRFADLLTYREHRIERCHRLLKYHRDVVAPYGLHLVFAELEQIGSLEQNFATFDPGRRHR